MKKVIVLLSFIALVSFVNAQQAATASAVKQATPVMKVDAAKPAETNVPILSNAEPAKACCAGKTAAECSHGKKACTKGETKAACCQKNGTAQTCNHAATEKAVKAKAE